MSIQPLRLRTSSRATRWLALAAGVTIWASGLLSAPPAQAFMPAKHTRWVDLLPHTYVGKPLRVISIVKDDGNPTDPTSFDNRMIYFGRAMVRNSWYNAMSAAYQLGSQGASLHMRVADMPTADGSLTMDALQTDVRVWMKKAGFGKAPKDRSIFVVYLPCVDGADFDGKTCGGQIGGFHSPMADTGSGDPLITHGDAIAIDFLVDGKRSIDSATLLTSHEVMEGATDTYNGWNLRANNPDLPFDVTPQVFVQGNARTEVGDTGDDSAIRVQYTNGTHSYPYRYQRIYTKASADANGDPFEPPSDIPYASVSTASTKWIRDSISQGGTVHIPVTAWSTAPVADWTLSITPENWLGMSGGLDDPCDISLSETTVNNGSVVRLTVSPTSAAAPLSWCAFRIVSSTPNGGGGDHDKQRNWVTGIEFTP